MRMSLLAAVVLLAASSAGAVGPAADAKAELMKLKDAYENASHLNRPDLILPYLAEDFSGKILFKDIQGRQGFKDTWEKIYRRFGPQENVRGYTIKLNPEKIDVNGDHADAEGTTEESVITPFGKLTFNTKWKAGLQKKDGVWRLARMDSQLDAMGSVSRLLAGFVNQAWSGEAASLAAKPASAVAKDTRLQFRRVANRIPDFDEDRQP